MKVDFSRDTFNERADFLRVLMQQGRVQVDADWNEQISIILHYLHTLATDVIGPHGGSGFPTVVTDKTSAETLVTTAGISVALADIDHIDIKPAGQDGFYYVQGKSDPRLSSVAVGRRFDTHVADWRCLGQ